VGIPRGLLFYRFYALWKTFLEELGGEVVISPPSNKPIIQRGLTYGVEEICFPVKVFLGHSHLLAEKVDFLFIPRVVSFHKGEYNCPKILGLPDLVRNLFQIPGERIIDDEINMRDKGYLGWRQGYLNLGRHFTHDDRRIMRALDQAEKAHQDYREKVKNGIHPEILIDGHLPLPERSKKVLILGHTYLVNDRYINMDIIQKINQLGYSVITADMVDENRIRHALHSIPKPSFWTISNEVLGSALSYIKEKARNVEGFIHLVSFECGPDSLVGELIERQLRRDNQLIPYLRFEIDEHTGEAGLITRLEAFADMMKWRDDTFESYLSPPRSS
ncbi:MAG: acyl-CoA dehydratase activase-related protein, partial [Candidatus Atribacteria bacterium]|nr:acyl-CoA dehydratase activase-related protein [Candidatus Atribacteria bacterium]